MNEKTKQGNQALQVLNKSELLGRQFTVYGTAENPLFLAKEERIKLKKARFSFQYDIEKANENRESVLSELYRKYNEDVHRLDEESRQMKEQHELQRIELLNEYEIVRRTSNVEV